MNKTNSSRFIFAFGGGWSGQHKDTYPDLKPENGAEYWPYDMKLVDDIIIGCCKKTNPKVLLLTTPTEDGRSNIDLYCAGLKRRFEDLGCETSNLRLLGNKVPKDLIEVEIGTADIIYVSGGNTLKAMQCWRKLGIDRLLQKAWQKGTIISGLSAGAVSWFKYACSNSRYDNHPFRVKCLGWVNALCCPHWDLESFRQEPFKSQIKKTPGMVGIALDEYVAIEIVDLDKYQIHPFRPRANAYKCYWYNGEYNLEKIPVSQKYLPLKTLLEPSPLDLTS